MNDHILNIATIHEIQSIDGDGHKRLLSLMITSYLYEVPHDIEIITRAVHDKQLGALAEHAHALKSSSVCIGADALGQLCGELELAAQENDISRALQLSTKLLHCFDLTKKALQAYL